MDTNKVNKTKMALLDGLEAEDVLEEQDTPLVPFKE
jgi:hypothetical protein